MANELKMASILASVNQTDLVIIDKQLSSVAASDDGGVGDGGSSAAGVDNGTSPSPAIWLSYNASSTNTIENTNASRHLADHADTSGAVGIEAIIIMAVVSLIPVSVIACMVFVISFNCLKKRNSLWSTSASPNTLENNCARMRMTDGGGGGGQGRRKSAAIRSMMENENDSHRFNGENGRNDDRIAIATIDTCTYTTPTSTCTHTPTPLSLIYPADAFSAYLDASKSSLTTTTTPISNNSVITMTMRNNHLIVETEERIPCCSLLDGQNFYACAYRDGGENDGGHQTADATKKYLLDGYHQRDRDRNRNDDDDDDDDEGLFDETDSFCQNRCCQHATYVGDNGCALCDIDDEDDDEDGNGGGGGGAADNCDRKREFIGGPSVMAFYGAPAIATTALATSCAAAAAAAHAEEEDHHVQIFHKNLPVAATGFSTQTIPSPLPPRQQQQQQQQQQHSRPANDHSDASCSYKYGEGDGGHPVQTESPTSSNFSRGGGVDVVEADLANVADVDAARVDAGCSQSRSRPRRDYSSDRSERNSYVESPRNRDKRFVESSPSPSLCVASKRNGIAMVEDDDDDDDDDDGDKPTIDRAGQLDCENGCDWTPPKRGLGSDPDTKSQLPTPASSSPALTSTHSPDSPDTSSVHPSHT